MSGTSSPTTRRAERELGFAAREDFDAGMAELADGDGHERRRARGSVLVVDDEPTIAEVVARYLERAGYTTRVAADGPAALALAEEGPVDLVVLDLMLPGIDGLEVDAPPATRRGGRRRRSSCSPPGARSPTGSPACGSAPTTTS